jgi:hypothetical protein
MAATATLSLSLRVMLGQERGGGATTAQDTYKRYIKTLDYSCSCSLERWSKRV